MPRLSGSLILYLVPAPRVGHDSSCIPAIFSVERVWTKVLLILGQRGYIFACQHISQSLLLDPRSVVSFPGYRRMILTKGLFITT
jgi:hypothetical protein